MSRSSSTTRTRSRRESGVGKLQGGGVVGGDREGGCVDHQVAHEFGIGRERADREDGRRRIAEAAGRERRCGHDEDPAGRLQPDGLVGEAIGPACEGDGVGGGLGIGEQQAV